MKYLSLDVIDLSEHPYPLGLNDLSITIRGTKNLFDIYFSADDIENDFCISLSPQIDFTWINTSSGRKKYLSYPTMKKILYPMQDEYPLAMHYLSWIDSLLFCTNKAKSLYRASYMSIPSSAAETSIDDDYSDNISDLDDTSSFCSLLSEKEDQCIVSAMQYKIDELEHQLQLKDKDIIILQSDIKLKDKEIELLKLKLDFPAQALWI